MLSVEDMIDKIRLSIHDEQETGYEDEALLGFINDAVRILRRTIMQIRPEILALPPFVGQLAAGENSVTLKDEAGADVKILRVVRATAGGKALTPCRIENIDDASGSPTNFFVTGFSNVNFYPAPNKAIDYAIVVVADGALLDFEDRTPFPLDIDDFVFEYAATRAQVSNEFDMTQESRLIQTITTQVEDYLRNLVRKPIFTQGYWNDADVGRYTKRRVW